MLNQPSHVPPAISRRASEIFDAAERKAETVLSEALEQGRRYLEQSTREAESMLAERQRRLAALSKELIVRADDLIAGLDSAERAHAGLREQMRTMAETVVRLHSEAAGTPQASVGTPSGRPPERAPAPEPQPRPQASPGASRAVDPRDNGAQIAAIQMAATGRTRAETEHHLRASLGVSETGSILDEVFGPGTAGEATVPWGRQRSR